MANRSLPAIGNMLRLKTTLQTWRATINGSLNKPQTPGIPRNFSATQAKGGNQLSWAVVSTPGVDGYEVLKSLSGDFSPGKFTIQSLSDKNSTSWFDSLGAATKVFYKIRATAGTQSNPQSVHGEPSGVISQTSLDPTSGAAPATSYDQATTDQSASAGRSGSYTSIPETIQGRSNAI